MHRVAITGVGIISCLGNDAQSVGNALRNGRSGIEADPERVELGFRSALTGRVRGFDASALLSRKQRKSMPEFAVWAYAAVLQALAQAQISPEDLRNDSSGLIFGCDSTSQAAVEQVDQLRHTRCTASIGSGAIFRAMNSTVTMNLNVLLGTRGACWTISSACSSGGHSIGQAADLIALGRQDRVLCGGAQEITWESICSFDGLGAFSTNPVSQAASRPFDADRDGLVPSGGAAAVLLERREAAERRGARILGEVIGYGFSSDGEHLSKPAPHGLATAMRRALTHADIAPADVDYICAHATATPLGDSVEAAAILQVFGPATPAVAALKSLTGHELWMAGASQVVYTTIMAAQGFSAAGINYVKGDEVTSRLNILTRTLDRAPRIVMCNSAGFGGTNCCLILRMR